MAKGSQTKEKKEKAPKAEKPLAITFDDSLKKKITGKRPASAYQSWILANREKIDAKAGDNVDLSARSKTAAAMWKEFKDDKKKFDAYQIKFEAEKVRYAAAAEAKLESFMKTISHLELPEGWAEATHAKSDKPYYYCRSLDDTVDLSQWERPYNRKELLAAVRAFVKESA